jgi:DNA ligase-associated metallophosphoesterase
LVLLAERAAYWERRSTLLVADPHFGKAASFRAAGVPVPRGTTSENLRRLDVMLERTCAKRILFLGDFLHAREGRSPETLEVIDRWRRSRLATELVLVRGNHDARAGDPPGDLNIQCVDEPLSEPPFVFTHHPQTSTAGYVIAGHVHPGVRLRGLGRAHATLPCFWFGDASAVLPAFGEFTGLADVTVNAADRVWAIAEGAVVRVH